MTRLAIGVTLLLASAARAGDLAPATLPNGSPPSAVTDHAYSARDGVVGSVIDVSSTPSNDFILSLTNHVILVWVGPLNAVTGIGWDVVLQTVHPGSRLSDISAYFIDSAGGVGSAGFSLTPGFGDNHSGGATAYSSGGEILKLADYSIPDVQALADGYIRVEFFEAIDDAVGATDGMWISGSIMLQTLRPVPPIPEPAAATVLLFAIIQLRRRGSMKGQFGRSPR